MYSGVYLNLPLAVNDIGCRHQPYRASRTADSRLSFGSFLSEFPYHPLKVANRVFKTH